MMTPEKLLTYLILAFLAYLIVKNLLSHWLHVRKMARHDILMEELENAEGQQAVMDKSDEAMANLGKPSLFKDVK
jgi:hypothetical protein